MRGWDGNFYIDEAIRFLKIPDDERQRKITLIGAGIGIKNETVELIDWCGIGFYRAKKNENKNKSGNDYWNYLGKQCLNLILEQEYRPEKIYICNQIAFYVMRAILSSRPRKELKCLAKKLMPVSHRAYKGENGIYQAKQKVGKRLREKLKVKISPEDMGKILQGRLYDLKKREIIQKLKF